MKDVAEEAGVSKATVSHVINKTRYVSPELTQRVNETMKELGYKPNAVARSLTTQRTQTIGLIVSDISNPFFSTLVRGVEDAAVENDYSLIVCNTDETLEKEKLYIDVLLQKKVDGLIIAPTGESDEDLKEIVKSQVPLVIIDRFDEDLPVDQVFSDNKAGGYKATEHLIQLGHRKIGLLIGITGLKPIMDRVDGYREALKDHGIEVDENLLAKGCSQIEEGYAATKSLLAIEGITAIFSTNNKMTLGALRCLKESGIKCPEEISLVGFDDSDWASTFTPSLTVVAQHDYKMGYTAGELLFTALDTNEERSDPKAIELETTLIPRESTAKPLGLDSKRRLALDSE